MYSMYMYTQLPFRLRLATRAKRSRDRVFQDFLLRSLSHVNGKKYKIRDAT